MEQMRKLRKIAIYLGSIYFQQKVPKQFNNEKIIFLTSSPRTISYPYAKKVSLYLYLTQYIKTNSK